MKNNETMKKTVRKTAAALLGITLAVQPVLSLASDYMVVHGGGLNLRETPSLEARVLGQYPTGTWIEVLEKGENWNRVNAGGKHGYMMNKYLRDAENHQYSYVRTNTGMGLNLRTEPSMQGKILTSFPVGTKVEVLQRGRDWSYVSVGTFKGYMNNRYLASAPAQDHTKPVTPYTATLININGGSIVNFRKAPGMKTQILRKLPVGTKVTVLETGENWSRVQVDGQQGYVSTYFLKK